MATTLDKDRIAKGQMRDLKLAEGEATAKTDLGVVLHGLAAGNGAELVQRAGSDLLSLLSAGSPADLLLGGLVEPGLHTPLPVLVEVSVRDDVVLAHYDTERREGKNWSPVRSATCCTPIALHRQ